MKRHLIVTLLLACLPLAVHSQTVAPLGGLGSVQFLDNNGAPLTSGVLYSYQAGTSTQQATFTDATGTIQNPNPITFGSGARAQIWTTIGSFYKFVLCVQNDGAFCAAGDILFTADNVPGGATGGGGGGGTATLLISASANPATSGIVRLASSDTQCWRNAAGSANLCWSKDGNDRLSWAGGSLLFPEVAAPAGSTGNDLLWADSTAHRWMMKNNGGSGVQFVASGVDINTSDQVTQLHFGATGTPLSGTPPATNQFLQWNGSNVVGGSPQFIFGSTGNSGLSLGPATVICALNTGAEACERVILSLPHTLVRFTYSVATAPTGCSTSPVIGIKDLTSGTTLASATITNGTSTVFVDSGALSVSMTAGDVFGIGVLTTAVGCGVTGVVGEIRAIIQ